MKKIKRVGLVIKPHAPRIEKILAELLNYFEKKGIECLLEGCSSFGDQYGGSGFFNRNTP